MGNLTAKTSGEIASFMSPSMTNIKSLKVHFSPKQLGEGDPSPENVREIEGWDGVEAYNDPKYSGFIVWNQLYNYGGSTGTNGGITYTKLDNGTWEVKGTSNTTSGTAARRRQIQSPSWEANHVYWFSARAVGEGTQYLQMVLSNSGSIKTTTTLYDGAFARPTEKINQFSFRVLTQNIIVDAIARPQIIDLTMLFGEEMADYIFNLEKSKSGAGKEYFLNLFPKDWYEYNAGELTTVSAVNNEPYTNLSINWSSDIGTVYGGYIDLISGELVEESKLWTKNTSEMNSGNSSFSGWWNCGFKSIIGEVNRAFNLKTNSSYMLNVGTYFSANTTGNYDNLYLPNSTYNLTQDEWKEKAIDVKIVAPLATPITHQLTPTQLKSFVGQNNFWSNADYVEIEYDLIETEDIQKCRKKIILNQPQLKTISDKIVSFNTDMVAPMKNCKIYFKPIQLGSGDASPTNVRNINGWTGLDSYVNGNKVSVDWTNDIGTVYGGYVDLVKGELVATQVGVRKKLSEATTKGQNSNGVYQYNFNFAIPYGQILNKYGSQKCSVCGYSWSMSDFQQNHFFGYYSESTGNRFLLFLLEDHGLNDDAEIDFMSELTSPVTFQLTPQQLLTLKSTNHIWSETNGQQIDVKYWTHKNLIPTPLVNYLENQTWTDSAYISSTGKKTTNTVSASHFLTNQILLEAGTYVLSGFSYYAGSDSTRYRIHAYDSTGKWLRQIAFQQIGNLSPVDISFTLDTDTYVNLSIAMDFDGVLAKIN